MTIIVFLIDSSASMHQRTFIGARSTLLDIAKWAVESFVKLRQRSPESRGDRYMLFSSEDPPNHIKAGWKENLATFMNELKNIQAAGLTPLGSAIKNVFDVLNINRMQSGIDNYGNGRNPCYLEPSIIILITDGGKLSSPQGVQDDIFPLPKTYLIPGAELTKEIFRWDQRLFTLVLRLTGTPTADTIGLVPSDISPLDKLCEQTGGRSYAVRTHRMFQQCIESLVQKVQCGVVINFEKYGPDPESIEGKDTCDIVEIDKENQANNDQICANNNQVSNSANSSWHNCCKMIYVPRQTQRGSPSFWPIPESFWPDSNILSLPARSAHPNLKFTCTNQEPMVIDNFPFDKYELERSPLTQFILSRKQPTMCWQVYVPNSSNYNDVGHPFGYLKASTNLQSVNLFVMPYNYPVLLPLLDELVKTHRLKIVREWKNHFDNYLRSMPSYYAAPLRRALGKMGAPQTLVPETLDNVLSYQVTNHLKRLKNQAKTEYDRICMEVEKRLSSGSSTKMPVEGIRVQSRTPLSSHLTSNHILQDKFVQLRDKMVDFSTFTILSRKEEVKPQMYRNSFDITRSCLIDQIARMRANFLQSSVRYLLTDCDHDQLHCRPINQMGNYQKMSVMVDEADVDLVGTGGAGAGNRTKRPLETPLPTKPNKRRKGPLPPEVSIHHLVISSTSEENSPEVTMASNPVNDASVVPLSVQSPLDMDLSPPGSPLASPDLSGFKPEYSAQPSPSPPHHYSFYENSVSLVNGDIDDKNLYQAENYKSENATYSPYSNTGTPNGILEESQDGCHFALQDTFDTHMYNSKLLIVCYKEVKRPGRDFSKLLENLANVKGSLDSKVKIIKSVITEAERFKRHSLIKVLCQFLSNLGAGNINRDIRPTITMNGHA